jgi:Flp pilus assembly protein TadG
MMNVRALVKRWRDCRSGSYATFFAILAPVLFGLVGGVVDLYLYMNHAKMLQNVADGAALSAVGGATLKGWSAATATATVESHVAANLSGKNDGTVYTTSVNVDVERRLVQVTIDQDDHGYFVVGYFKHSPQIRVQASAQSSGSLNVCVIGLDPKEDGAVSLDSNSKMTAGNCAVYSNSVSHAGLQSKSNSVLTAQLTCSVGGYEGASRNFQGEVVTDCPKTEDPLASVLPPPSGRPRPIREVKDKVDTLTPGLYEGGLKIDGNSDIRMSPGVYIFRNGSFIVDSNSKVTGKGVSLVFEGEDAGFEFKSNVQVDLEAPEAGQLMAGLLVYQKRNAGEAEFLIESKYTRKLLGTLYMPNGHFIVKADNRVAEASAYTAIVARTIRLHGSSNLVLNTDYDATRVPVPVGLGPSEGKVRLTN